VRLAKRLYRANPVTGKRRSLRQIAKELAGAGHLNTPGRQRHWIELNRSAVEPADSDSYPRGKRS